MTDEDKQNLIVRVLLVRDLIMNSLFSFIFGKGTKRSDAPEQVESIGSLLSYLSDLSGGSRATSAQKAAVDRLGFGEAPGAMSAEQANALLSARTYAQAVADKATKDNRIEREVSRRLVGFIVADRSLLERVMKWDERSFSRGRGEKASPKKDEYWARSLAEARRLASVLS